MKRHASETDLLSAEGWRLDTEVPLDQLARLPGPDGGHGEDLLLANVASGRRRLNDDSDGGTSCFLEQIEGEAQFPFESAAGLTGPGGRHLDGAGGSSSGARGTSPYAFGDGVLGFEGAAASSSGGTAKGRGEATEDQRQDLIPTLDPSRRASEQDWYGQTSLERLEEENGSLRAITKYLIHERKELRKKADTASKRNQNLSNLVHVMKWSLQQGSVPAAGGARSSRALSPAAAEAGVLLG
jgi:hypothetical protein